MNFNWYSLQHLRCSKFVALVSTIVIIRWAGRSKYHHATLPVTLYNYIITHHTHTHTPWWTLHTVEVTDICFMHTTCSRLRMKLLHERKLINYQAQTTPRRYSHHRHIHTHKRVCIHSYVHAYILTVCRRRICCIRCEDEQFQLHKSIIVHEELLVTCTTYTQLKENILNFRYKFVSFVTQSPSYI